MELNELRKIAAQATQGEWWTKQFEANVCDIFAGDGSGDNPGVAEAWHPEDATHIATFDPPTVLAILSRLEQAEQAVQRVRELGDAWKSRGEHSMKYSETLQWPVAEAIHEGGADMVNNANLIYRALDGDRRG